MRLKRTVLAPCQASVWELAQALVSVVMEPEPVPALDWEPVLKLVLHLSLLGM